MSESRIQHLAKSATQAVAAKSFGKIIYFVSQIVFARVLGPASFGVFVLAWTIVRISSTVGELGLRNGVIHFGTQHGSDVLDQRQVITNALTISVIAAVVLAGAILTGSRFLDAPLLRSTLSQLAPFTPFVILLGIGEAITRISGSVKYSVLAADLVQPAIGLALFILLGLLVPGLDAVVWATGISFLVATLVAFAFVVRLFPAIREAGISNRGGAVELLRYSLPTAFAGVLYTLNLWIDRAMLGYFRPPAELGYYHVAVQVSVIFTVILSSFNAVLSPTIAQLHFGRDSRMLEKLFTVSTRWGIFVSAPIFLMLLFFADEFCAVAFGIDYAAASLPLKIVTLGQIANVATGAVGLILIMTGNQKIWLMASSVAVIVNVSANLLLIPKFGAAGAASASAIANVILFGGALIEVKRRLSLSPYNNWVGRALLAGAVSAGCLTFVSSLVEGDVAVLLIGSVVSLAAFSAVLLVVGLDDDDRLFMRSILSKM